MSAVTDFLAKVHAEYTVVDGIIRNPGKYECECVWVPYYWDLVLDGEGEDELDEDGESVATRDMQLAYAAADKSEAKGVATIVRFDAQFRA